MAIKVRRSAESYRPNWIALIGFVLFALLAGFIGSLATVGSIPTWYMTLQKPFYTPPNWLFGPVWALLYLAMGVAAYFVWEKSDFKPKAQSFYGVYLLQLVFNVLWSIVFFGAHQIRLAILIIVILWYLIYRLIGLGGKLDSRVPWLLYPYLAWVSFASLLNLGIAVLN